MTCQSQWNMREKSQIPLLGDSCVSQCMFCHCPFLCFLVVEAHVEMASPSAWVPDGSVNILSNLWWIRKCKQEISTVLSHWDLKNLFLHQNPARSDWYTSFNPAAYGRVALHPRTPTLIAPPPPKGLFIVILLSPMVAHTSGKSVSLLDKDW